MDSLKKSFCMGCGEPFIDGEGFVEGHRDIAGMMCINERYGWNYTREEGDEGRPLDEDVL